MDRKKTIIIAVMINAGLLMILCIAALTSQDDPLQDELLSRPAPKPLFSDLTTDTSLAKLEIPVQIPLLPIEVLESPKAAVESPIVHKLPTPVVESSPVLTAPKKEISLQETVVKKGDSLDKIAKQHQTTVSELMQVNLLTSSALKVGQVLKIPEKKAVEAAAQKPKNVPEKVAGGPEYYTVKVGDNPWGIAMKNHMKVEELLKLNQLNEERARKLKPGDRLRIR